MSAHELSVQIYTGKHSGLCLRKCKFPVWHTLIFILKQFAFLYSMVKIRRMGAKCELPFENMEEKIIVENI